MEEDGIDDDASGMNSPRTVNRLLWLIVALFLLAAAVFVLANWDTLLGTER